MDFSTRNLTPNIGAKISCSAEALVNGAFAPQIRDALEARGVLVFPQVHLSDAQQVAFTETLGAFAPEGEANGVFRVSLDERENVYADYLRSGFFWHIDGTMDERPIRASILSCRRVSEIGGQTEFSNTYAAYDSLSDADKTAIEKLQVLHTFVALQTSIFPEPSYAQLKTWRAHRSKVLPMVWSHLSGRKSLILGNSADHVIGMDRDDSFDLLTRLRDHATQSDLVYRHEWRVGDMVMWDNCGTMHRALPYPRDSGRLMHRTKIKGEEAFA